MTSMKWDPAYSVGHPLLDSDHRLLISLVNQLEEAVETGQGREVVGSVLMVLSDYTEHHFEREEQLMARSGCPRLDRHREEHERLKAHVAALAARYGNGDRSATSHDVLCFLKKWLTDHIMVADKDYGPWVDSALAGWEAPPKIGVG